MKMGFTAGVVFGMIAGAATALGALGWSSGRDSIRDLVDRYYVCRMDLAHANGLLAKHGIVEEEASK
jgi:hypothetical protein